MAASNSGKSNAPKGFDVDDLLDDRRRLEDGDVPEDFLKVTEPVHVPTGTIVDLGDTEDSSLTKVSPSPAAVSVVEEAKPPPAGGKLYESDHAMALALQKQLDLEGVPPSEAVPGGAGGARPAALQLTVTVVEAQLARNYGLTRMDPYCRIRVGHSLMRTPTVSSGSKEPKWNETFHVILLPGTESIYIEVFDECTFTSDALVAHGSIGLPSKFTPSKVIDDWWPLSGREGPEKEGMIHIIYSINQVMDQRLYLQTATPAQRPIPKLTPEELDEYKKMFPNIDKDTFEAVYVACKGDKTATVNALLDM